jgi:enoyl-CoA hydratase
MNNVITEKKDRAAIVTINRPKALNALNRDTLEELLACFAALEEDREIAAAIITGAGDKAFVAGADISAMQDMDTLAGREFGQLGQRVMNSVETFSRPVIGAINGFALGGGCELALACDFRIASETARFGQPEVNLGVIPGFGGSQRLPRLVGAGHAMELLVTGEIIDAEQACRIGLVNRVVSAAQLMDECLQVVEKISRKGPLAVRLCKEAVRGGMQMDIDRACRYESELFGICFASADQKEGMRAFLEKRPANF